jgi:hypothetical protein
VLHAAFTGPYRTSVTVGLNQQSNPDDPFDWFSGSAGLVAAAEGILLFRRKRGEADAYLTVDGKDVEEKGELALKWDALAATWTVIGDAETHRLNKERREIIELMKLEGEPMGPKAVATALGKDYAATRQMMSRMHDDGQLKQEGYGKYVPLIISHSSHSSHTSTNGLSVTSVTGVTPPLSADEGNARVQELIDQGMRADLAAAEVTKRMRVGG